MMKLVLMTCLMVAVANAIVCPPNVCDSMTCENLKDCNTENGMFIKEKGGFCQCCDVCVKALREGEQCIPVHDLTRVVTSVCGEFLTCDHNTHRCVLDH